MNILQALTDEELEVIAEALEKCEWYDGKGSARGTAKEKKNNAQATSDQDAFKPINEILESLFYGKLKHYVFPSKLVGVRAAVYSAEQNGKYDWHVDYSHMTGRRTDISFTLFISDRTKYEGGELDIENRGLNFAVKGKSGELVLYSTGDRHRVRPVTKGTRLVIVGWISSLVPDIEKRDVLIDYWNIMQSLPTTDSDEDKDRIGKANENYMKIMRLLSI